MEFLNKPKKSAQVEKPQSHNPDISALAQFQSDSKNSDLISKIGIAIGLKSIGKKSTDASISVRCSYF